MGGDGGHSAAVPAWMAGNRPGVAMGSPPCGVLDSRDSNAAPDSASYGSFATYPGGDDSRRGGLIRHAESTAFPR